VALLPRVFDRRPVKGLRNALISKRLRDKGDLKIELGRGPVGGDGQDVVRIIDFGRPERRKADKKADDFFVDLGNEGFVLRPGL
jgi:hypothetical protein